MSRGPGHWGIPGAARFAGRRRLGARPGRPAPGRRRLACRADGAEARSRATRRPRHRARRARRAAAAHRRRARRGALSRRARRSRTSSRSSPTAAQAATERTETWIAFDDDYVYVSFRVWDSQHGRADRDRDAARQHQQLAGQRPRRRSSSTPSTTGATPFTFTINPLGGRSDGQVVNERQYSSDWNPVWEIEDRPLRRRLDGRSGGAVQVAALSAGHAQVWGFNAMRVKRSKNEISTLTRVPPARGQSGVPAGAVRGHARRHRGAAQRAPTSISSRTRSRA